MNTEAGFDEPFDLEEVLLLGEHNDAGARDSFLEKMDTLLAQEQKQSKWRRKFNWQNNTMFWQFGSPSKGGSSSKAPSPTSSVSSLSSLWSMASGKAPSDEKEMDYRKQVRDLPGRARPRPQRLARRVNQAKFWKPVAP